jgi:hypothetical protein
MCPTHTSFFVVYKEPHKTAINTINGAMLGYFVLNGLPVKVQPDKDRTTYVFTSSFNSASSSRSLTITFSPWSNKRCAITSTTRLWLRWPLLDSHRTCQATKLIAPQSVYEPYVFVDPEDGDPYFIANSEEYCNFKQLAEFILGILVAHGFERSVKITQKQDSVEMRFTSTNTKRVRDDSPQDDETTQSVKKQKRNDSSSVTTTTTSEPAPEQLNELMSE